MMSSTIRYSSVATKCILAMTRVRQPLHTSLCCASHILNKLPEKQWYCTYSTGVVGDVRTYQERQRIRQSVCVTSLMNISNFQLGSCVQPLPCLRTPLFSRNITTNGNKQTEQNKVEQPNVSEPEKLTLLQRFKQMYRDYWYVLVPVHLITSLGWFAGFYYLAKSGMDVVALLESVGISERVINPLRDSSAGYIALAYALYKIATPLRYTVTLGGTTISINYLKEWGYIKPIPPRQKLKEMYHEKKATLIRETTEELKLQQEKLKKTRESMMRGYRERAGKSEK